MTRTDRRALLVVLLGCVAVATAAAVGTTGGASAANATDGHEPTAVLVLDGSGIGDGGYRVVDGNPSLRVRAAVGSNAAEGTELRTVSIRVNGQTERIYDPGSRNASVSVDLPLRRGNNSVHVVVEDTDGALTERRITVAKDDLAPWIGLTSPYETDRRAVVPNGTVTESLVTFGVESSDFTGIRRGTVTVDHDGGSDSVAARDPGLTFERDLLLGYGNNTVEIDLEDRVGNGRTERFRVELVDESRPEIDLDLYPRETTAAAVDLSGRLTDNVWVRNASVTVEHLDAPNVTSTGTVNHTEPLRRDTPYRYAREGRTVPFEERLLLRHGRNRIELTARDHLGQTRNRTVEITRVRSPREGENDPPEVSLDTERTRLLGDGRVRVVATVSDPDWNLDSVAVETENGTDGELTDYERFGDLGSRRSFAVETTLAAANGTTVVRVRAGDAESARTLDRYRLVPEPTPTPTPTAASTAPRTPTPTATPTATRTPAATSTVAATPTNGSANATAESGSLPLIGSLPSLGSIPVIGGAVDGAVAALPLSGVADALTTGAPFVVGGLVVVTVGYFVTRRVRGGESA